MTHNQAPVYYKEKTLVSNIILTVLLLGIIIISVIIVMVLLSLLFCHHDY